MSCGINACLLCGSIYGLCWVLLNYLFIIFNKSRHCLVCRPSEAVPVFPFPRVWFSSGAVPSGNVGGWWFMDIIYFTKWSAVCRSLRARLPRRTLTLELKAFTQLLLLRNGLNSLSIRQTQIVLEMSEKGPDGCNICQNQGATSVNANHYLLEERSHSSESWRARKKPLLETAHEISNLNIFYKVCMFAQFSSNL